MRIIVAGGTGFLGQALVSAVNARGHDVLILTRGPAGPPDNRVTRLTWNPDGSAGAWASAVDHADAVINLAGASIGDHRWSPAEKRKILDSRVNATRSLASAIARASTPPPLLISQSAIGYYGSRGDEAITEDTTPGSDFLAGVCVRWEDEAMRAASPRTRVVCVRTGLVLAATGGPLPQMLPPFKFGVGGPLGSGRQYWSWIHLDDWVALMLWIIDTSSVVGAVNATAPNPVTNGEFARALGRALHRPALMPAPPFALRLLLGEMADALLLWGQRVVPEKAMRLGFTFKYARVDEALRAIFSAGAAPQR